MKTNKTRITAALLVPAILSLSMAQAAQPVQWDDLPNRVGPTHKERQYQVVTKDGAIHKGVELSFSPIGVTVSSSEPSIPREQVREIRIRRDRSVTDALLAPAGKVFGPLCGNDDFGCLALVPLFPVVIPVAVGITIGAAPIVLPIEGIKHLAQDKVIKVAP